MIHLNDPERQRNLIKLCYLFIKRHNAEQAYDRAMWRVAYYRKFKNPGKTNKNWSDPAELLKKIDEARLDALQKQKQLAEIRKDKCSFTSLKNSLFASNICASNGRTVGIRFSGISNKDEGLHELNMDQIYEIVDQYEADTALTKALEDNTGYATDVC
jgi:CRISPR/Cas system CMR-associated protein Cmr1 (group 7 of RAMP superfamily)